MFRRNKKTRKYQAPAATEMRMALESNFCETLRFKAQVDELESVNERTGDKAESMYFEF